MQSNKEKKIRILILSLFLTGIVAVFSIKLINAIKQTNKAFEEDLPSTYKLTSDDSVLFDERDRSKIKVNEIVRSKVRGPISFILFENKYHITTYKIDLTDTASLTNIIHTQVKNFDQSTGYSYRVLENNIFFKVKYKSGIVNPASEIFFTLAGDSFKTVVKNDSVFSYYLLCNNLSIRYGSNEPVDLFVVGKKKGLRTIAIPMDILFFRKNKALYFLIMAPINPQASIPPSLLYDIVMNE